MLYVYQRATNNEIGAAVHHWSDSSVACCHVYKSSKANYALDALQVSTESMLRLGGGKTVTQAQGAREVYGDKTDYRKKNKTFKQITCARMLMPQISAAL